jgi:hypothetical protein
LVIIIIHKKHFEKDNDNPIPAPAKDRFPLISVNQIETINSVFQTFSTDDQKVLDQMANKPNDFNLHQFIQIFLLYCWKTLFITISQSLKKNNKFIFSYQNNIFNISTN